MRLDLQMEASQLVDKFWECVENMKMLENGSLKVSESIRVMKMSEKIGIVKDSKIFDKEECNFMQMMHEGLPEHMIEIVDGELYCLAIAGQQHRKDYIDPDVVFVAASMLMNDERGTAKLHTVDIKSNNGVYWAHIAVTMRGGQVHE